MNKMLISFIRKEFRQSLRDPSMKQLLFVTPVILLLVFGFALVNESRNIRLAVRLDPKDTVLRQVYDRALGTKWFIPGISDPDGDPFQMIDNGDAEAVLIPPPGGLTQSIERGDGKLQLLINGVDVLRAQAIEQYLNAIVTEVATREMNIVTTQPPIHFEVRTLYNPSLSTAAFMLPGTMMLVILQITVVITAMAIAKEKETGTYETMISAPISPREIVFGKTIPYILLGMVNIPVLLSVVRFVFHVPIRGSLVLILLCTLIFVCVTVAAGALIGTVTKSQQQAFMLSFLFVFPGVLMSGTFFPVENMPAPLKAIAYINPMTHFLVLLRNLLLKGGNFEVVALHLGVLVLMGVAFGVISFRRMHTTLN